MRNRLLTILFLLVSFTALCQVKGSLINSLTHEKIPYVNIWIENENIGTTSNSNGEFILPLVDGHKLVVFSAVGFETKKMIYDSLSTQVELIPSRVLLKELVIYPKRERHNTKIGSLNKLKTHHYFGGSSKPWIVARYFPFSDSYKVSPFLNHIKLITKSDIDESQFVVRILTVKKNGEPGENILNQNVFGIAKKGKKITKVDFSDFNVQFPENGFFIAIEWLVIDQNKVYRAPEDFFYEPLFGTIDSDLDSNGWVYLKGKWQKATDLSTKDINFWTLAIELNLTD